MYLSSRATQVRNLSVALVNGSITLVILLIAPLGLAAVIINTLLVTVATYLSATAADRVALFLSSDRHSTTELSGRDRSSQLQRSKHYDLEEW